MTYEDKLKKATFNLWSFAISKFLSSMGGNVFSFGISLFILGTTGSATSFAINLLSSSLPRAILSPISGYIADKYSKKLIIITSQFISILIVSSLLIFSLVYELNLIAIYVTTALLSIFSMFSGITFTSAIANLVDHNRIQKAIAFNQTSISISTIAAPVLGGFLYGIFTIELFLVFHIITFLLAITFQFQIDFKLFKKESPTNKFSQNEGFISSYKLSYQYLKKEKTLLIVLYTAFIVNFFYAAITVGLPFILIEQLSIEPEHFGIIEGSFAAGMLMASLYFSVKKEFQYPLIILKRGVFVIAFNMICFIIPIIFSMSYSLTVFYFITLVLIIGMTIMFINTPIGVIIQKGVDDSLRGKIFATMESVATFLSPISFIIYGFLFDLIGIVWTVIPTALLMTLYTTTVISKKNIKLAYPAYNPKNLRLVFKKIIKNIKIQKS